MVLEKLKEENTVIALIGASNDKQKYGNKIYCDLRSKGYNVVPINPKEKLIEGFSLGMQPLANKYPNQNFIGIDIKGARIWKGAKDSISKDLKNVCFVRCQIELIDKIFAKN